MKAAVLHAVGDLRIEERPIPVAGPGEVLVRVGSCGVCGSDVPRVFRTGTYRFPTVCGHEFAGTVVEAVGDLAGCGKTQPAGGEGGATPPGQRASFDFPRENSDRRSPLGEAKAAGCGKTEFFSGLLAAGTPVAVFPLLWCGRCQECERGAYARCTDYGYLGSRSDGGFAEYVVAPRRNLLPLPAGVGLDDGAMVEPAAVALHALRRANLVAGETVAVFGAGPIGLLVAQWARALGAARVVVCDVAAPALALARTLGFSEACDPRSPEIVALAAGRGADVTVEAAGVPATFAAAINAAAPGGRVVLLGNPTAEVVLPAALISRVMRRELNLVGTWNSTYSASGLPDDWRTVLAAVAAGSIRLAPLVTHRFALNDTLRGLTVLRDRREFVGKVLIHP